MLAMIVEEATQIAQEGLVNSLEQLTRLQTLIHILGEYVSQLPVE